MRNVRFWLLTAIVALAVGMSGCPARRSGVPPAAEAPAKDKVATAEAPASERSETEERAEPEESSPVVNETPEPSPAGEEQEPTPASETSWKTFQGAWFTIKYPADFAAKPQEKSPTGKGYDGALFVSPDGQVEFYVNSPQWEGGGVGWIDATPGEDIVDTRTQKDGSKETTKVTLAGPGRKYLRMYEDTTDRTEKTRLVFGFRYPDNATRDAYRERYLKFKASLEQFAD
jgi:hypothetical protein